MRQILTILFLSLFTLFIVHSYIFSVPALLGWFIEVHWETPAVIGLGLLVLMAVGAKLKIHPTDFSKPPKS